MNTMLQSFLSKRIVQIFISEAREKPFIQTLTCLRFKTSTIAPEDTDELSIATTTMNYLINSCGLSPESASLVSKKFRIKSAENSDYVLKLLMSHGFSKTQISNIVTKCPSILSSNADNMLLPKINAFKENGIGTEDIAKIISTSPTLFKASLEKQIIPSFNYLRSILGTNDNIAATLRHSSRLFQSNLEEKIAPNISILQKHGVPACNIRRMIIEYPRTMLLSVDRFRENVEFVKEIGIEPTGLTFTGAIRVVCGMKKCNWEKKVELYRSFGWSKEEIFTAFAVQPLCMMISEKKMKKVMDILQKEMGWAPVLIAKCPNILLYSLEKRTIPRCLVLQKLISKGLIKNDEGLIWDLNCYDMRFLKKFIFKFQDLVPEILDLYPRLVQN